MDKLTRKELKSDKFAEEVKHSVAFVTSHRAQSIRYGGAALAVVALSAGIYYFRDIRYNARQRALADALKTKEAVVTLAPQPGDPRMAFPNPIEKDKAVQKAFLDITTQYGGSNEASVAYYQLGSIAADEGKLDQAEKHFKAAVESGDKDHASVAKLSLAQVHQAQNKLAEAEKELREMMAGPTLLVSKEQAMFALARVLAVNKVAEARKLLDPLQKDQRIAVARNASALLAELPAQ